jgi:hypothetical protein
MTANLFPTFPEHSRVWVYQANRKFTDEEMESLRIRGSHFIRDWNTHGASVSGDMDIIMGCFVVIVADEQEQMVSGCAIDRSVSLIKEIEQLTHTNLFDRFSVAIYKDDEIYPMTMDAFMKGVKGGEFDGNTKVFNNTITTLKQLRHEWIVQVKDSWHARFADTKQMSF